MNTLLEIKDLSVSFGHRHRAVLNKISFSLVAGKRLGLIGESGSGKTVTALAIMGLLPENAQITGSIKIKGKQIVGVKDSEISQYRGNLMAMVFQEPMTALDPTMKVGKQLAEVASLHGRKSRSKILSMKLLERVGLSDSERIASSYPHQLSGGQRQRVLIAMALINYPDLVICDEPTTALDVTVQKRILKLLDIELAQRGCLFISHDLAVMAQICDEVAVMLHGEIVEMGSLENILYDPQHSYTKGLLASAKISSISPGQRLPMVSDFYSEN